MRSSKSQIRCAFRRHLLVVGLLQLAIFAGCADWTRGTPSPIDPDQPIADGGSTAGLSFQNDVRPLLVARCASCHSTGGSASTTGFILSDDPAADFQMVQLFLSPSTPSDSSLLTKGAGFGHGAGGIYLPDDEEYAVILAWIEQGALP